MKKRRWTSLILACLLVPSGLLLLLDEGFAVSPAAPGYFVYDDTLHWQNWSWNTRVNPNDSSPVFSGRKSMEVEFRRAWAALSLHTDGFDTSPYSSLSFAIRPEAGGEDDDDDGGSNGDKKSPNSALSSIGASLYNSSNIPINRITIAPYASSSSKGWYQVSIPLAKLGGADTTITRVQLQDISGRRNRQTFHIDDLQFVGDATPSPTPTPVPTVTPTPMPTSTPVPPATPAPTPSPTSTPVPPATPTPTPSPTPTPMPTPTPPPPPPPVQPLVPQPGSGDQVVSLFQQPFAGDFPLHNVFDHDLPFHSNDTNGFLLTWWGGKTVGRWGGTSSAKLDGHDGWDWLMPEGTPILAVAGGTVTRAHVSAPFWCPELQRMVDDSLGVEIRHQAPNGEQYVSAYYHLSRADVQVGDQVVAGQQIALSGNAGCSTVPHLHLGVFKTTNTKTGDWTKVDPYGWEADGPDPWEQHAEGSQSVWMWVKNSAPVIYIEEGQALNPKPGDQSPVVITVVRWMGWKDSDHPNNEFVQVELDPRFAPSGTYDLSGARIMNNQGSAFVFPDGFLVRNGAPVRVFTGPGANSTTTLYWGLSAGVWDDVGDCARLVLPDGQVLSSLTVGGASCTGG